MFTLVNGGAVHGEENLVSAADVARLAGVGRAAVSNWRRRHPDFPEPVSGSAGSRFRLAEVERWLRSQGKLRAADGEDTLWRAVSVGRDDTEITRLLGDVLEHLHGHSGVDLPAPVRDEVDRIEAAARADTAEQLCLRHVEASRRRHSATTVELAELMAELSDPHGVVLDPACGIGNALRAAAGRGAERVLGQELDPDLARLAQARLRFHAPASVVAGDALRADGHPDMRADVVFCEPPFGYRDWGYEELGVDRRWDYGLPVKNEPELAWLQHCLAHVRPGGFVVGLLPAAVASRRSGRLVRKELVRRGVVRAVFALPAGLLATTGIPLHLWLLRAPADDDTPMSVLLVDASEHGGRARGEADWPALRSAVLEPWKAFRGGAFEPVPGRHDIVQAIDLLDEDVDLTPARHLPMPRAVVDPAELDVRRRRLGEVLTDAAELLPTVTAQPPRTHPTLTISELAKAGALTVRQHTGKLELSDSDEVAGELVLTGRDVADGVGPTLRLARTVDTELVHLVPGDVVVPTLVAGGTHAVAGVVEEPGLILGPNLHLLRVDPARLDAEFLAGYLSASRTTAAGGTTVSGARRLDVRRVGVPLLPIAEQQRLGRAFRAVRLFRERLREAGELADLLGRQLVDGLADGLLDVPDR